MNIAKKLKLALLATSVMLFPKAGYTVHKDLNDDKAGAGTSRQLRAGVDFMSAEASSMPGNSSDQAPPAAAAPTLQQTTIPGYMPRMEQDFGRAFSSSKEIMGASSLLWAGKFNGNHENHNKALQNIRETVFDQFVFPFTLEQRRSNSITPDTLKAITPALQDLALTSLNVFLNAETLEGGIKALKNRTDKINELVFNRLYTSEMDGRYFDGIVPPESSRYFSYVTERSKSVSLSLTSPHYISLISDLLRLQPEQMQSFSTIIHDNRKFSVQRLKSVFSNTFRDINGDISSFSTQEKISVLGFLAKKSPKELKEIQRALEEVVPEKSRRSRMHRNFLEELLKLDFDKFIARVQRFDAKIFLPSSLTYLYGSLEKDLLSLSLRIEDEDFTDFTGYVNHAEIGEMDLLMPRMVTRGGDRSLVLNPPLWKLSFKELKERILAIEAYSGLLYEAAQEGTDSNIEGTARFMALTPAEIYETARSQHAKNYFFKSFLPEAKIKYEEINELPASEPVLQTLFPSKNSPLTDFSPEVLQGKLGNFRDLFQLPPFPEFQPSGSIESGPTSSMPRPELEEAAPSSSSSIHSTPTTFRTTGANEKAEIKHSAIYASFPYQNKPDAAYSLIINHRTKDKGSEVRVFNPNTKTYIDLGRLSSSTGFSDQIFNLSSLFEGAPSSSSGASIMRTELNFIDGISDIHSFTIKSGEERLMEVILGDKGSEQQTGVYVYAPEASEKLQEWSKASSEDVE